MKPGLGWVMLPCWVQGGWAALKTFLLSSSPPDTAGIAGEEDIAGIQGKKKYIKYVDPRFLRSRAAQVQRDCRVCVHCGSQEGGRDGG